MKVRELQQHLSKLDPQLEVVCYSEDDKFLVKGRLFILLDILAVDTIQAERLRLDDGTPYLKLGESPAASRVATLDVTADF